MPLKPLRKPDPTELTLSFRQYGGEWYLEWRNKLRNSAPIMRRKAHDTEVQLINRIQHLEAVVSGVKPASTLGLRRMLPLKTITVRRAAD